MATWEETFSSWARGPGKTEEERCNNAVRAILEATKKSPKLRDRDVRVWIHGSYRNRVNVRRDSDVDAGVSCHDAFFFDLPEGTTRDQFGINSPADYNFATFKDELQEALEAHFGAEAVHRGNKAFDIKENSYRVEADVAPLFEYRRYHTLPTPGGFAVAARNYYPGYKMITDKGQVIINWPEQHYENGVAKNNATSRRFKRVVRILKALSVYMEEKGNKIAANTPGFLIECMAYNVANSRFAGTAWYPTVRTVLADLFNETLTADKCAKWTEVSELKWLFHHTQPWTVSQAHAWTDAAWNFVGFE